MGRSWAKANRSSFSFLVVTLALILITTCIFCSGASSPSRRSFIRKAFDGEEELVDRPNPAPEQKQRTAERFIRAHRRPPGEITDSEDAAEEVEDDDDDGDLDRHSSTEDPEAITAGDTTVRRLMEEDRKLTDVLWKKCAVSSWPSKQTNCYLRGKPHRLNKRRRNQLGMNSRLSPIPHKNVPPRMRPLHNLYHYGRRSMSTHEPRNSFSPHDASTSADAAVVTPQQDEVQHDEDDEGAQLELQSNATQGSSSEMWECLKEALQDEKLAVFFCTELYSLIRNHDGSGHLHEDVLTPRDMYFLLRACGTLLMGQPDYNKEPPHNGRHGKRERKPVYPAYDDDDDHGQ